MAQSFCKVSLLGNLGQNPELRHTGNGTPVVNLSVATNHGYTNGAGEFVEQTEWHNVVAFGRLAETCGEFLRKGSQILVEEARLQTRSWEDNEGVTRYTTEVKAFKIQFLDRDRSNDRPNDRKQDSARSGNRQGSGDQQRQGRQPARGQGRPQPQPKEETPF